MIKEGTAHVLIDLRDPEKAAGGFIKGSVSIPASELSKAKDRFPANKTAPIILVDEAQASDEAFGMVRSWGYVNTSVLRGGISSWKSDLVKGPPGSKIEYVKRLKPGEIAIDEFRAMALKRPADTIIMDVREGAVEGRLPDALSLPNNELEARLGEVPKDKAIVIHCNTGILARMAYNDLSEKGYKNIRYLNAVLLVAKDGSFEITEK